jgi:TolA-binding protein
VGYCYLALGQTDKGRFALEQVTTIYPKTEPAGLAAKRLETIGP